MKPLFVCLLFIIETALFAQTSITFTSDKSTFTSGQEFQINYTSNPVLGAKAWVGLFNGEEPKGSAKNYTTYQYVYSEPSKTLSFKAPIERGNYQLRVFANDPGEFITSLSFTVEDISQEDVVFTFNQEDIKPSKPFAVAIDYDKKISFNPKAWLGIFPGNSDKSLATGFLSYIYLYNTKENIFTLNAPNEPGNYELRFYSADPGSLIKTIPIRVGELDLPGLAFSLNKAEFGPEEDLIVTYIGHKDLTNKSWFGIFKADAKPGKYEDYLSYNYLRDLEKGSLNFKTPSEKGDYQIRLFFANEGPMLLTSIPFSVSSSLDKSFIETQIEKEGKISLYGIYFDVDKSEVKAASFPLVEEISKILKGNPELKIRIEGHTDSSGEDSYNQGLSEKRSRAIMQLLITKFSVNSNQLEAAGFGESRPIGNNNTSEGRAQNRRVELVKIQ